MKIVKKVLLSSFIMFIIFSCLSFSKAESNTSTISGCVKTKDGSLIENVKVKIISNGKAYEATTNQDGKYYVEVEKGKYRVEFEHENIYTNPEVTLKKFETYLTNVELAYLYDNSISIEQINKIEEEVKKIFPEGKKNIIERPHSNGTELENSIRELELDEENDKAFHKALYEGWKSIAIIISRYQDKQIEPYLKAVKQTNYKYVIASIDESKESITQKVKKALSMSDSEKIIVTDKDTITDTSVQTKEIDFQEDAEVDVTLEKELLEGGNMSFASNDTLFNGTVFVNGVENSNNRVQVTLRNITTGEYYTKIVSGGEYKFDYPNSNDGDQFKLEFTINHKELNGQNYEVSSEHVNINSANINDNIAYETNRQNLIENFKDIKFTQEKQIEKTEKASSIGNADEATKLLAQTDNFTIVKYEDVKEEGSLELSHYCGAIKLQEREKFSLTVEQYINNIKVTLSDGSILVDWNYEKAKQGAEVQYIATTEDFSIVTMDNEIKHGATIQVEYAIKITNNSNIECSKFTLIDYLTYSGAKFGYNENLKLLSDGGKTNKDVDWSIMDTNELKNYLDYEPINKETATFLKYEYEGSIKKDESETIYLTASTIMSTETDINSQFYNEVELAQYSNKNSRRNYDTNGNAIKAGNYNIDSGQTEQANMEKDSDKVRIAIVPPYGKQTQNNYKLITIVIAVICILIVRKWKRGKKYDKKRKKY